MSQYTHEDADPIYEQLDTDARTLAIENLRSILEKNSLDIENHRTVVHSIFYKNSPQNHPHHNQKAHETIRVVPTDSRSERSMSKPDYLNDQDMSYSNKEPETTDSLPLYSTSTAAVQVLADDEHLFGLKPADISINYQLQEQDGTPTIPITPIAHDQMSIQDQTVKLDPSDFIIHGILGEGGMGQIFTGTQSCLKREVAFKISKTDSQDPRLLAQICHEAQITAQLDHPNIMPIYLLARSDDGRPIQVMKRIAGISWHDLMYQIDHPLWTELNQINNQQAFHLEVLVKVSQAMSYAHERGIIHRDLKPENVMIGKFGEVYILDWGVALDLATVQGKSTDFWAQQQSGLEAALVGTPAYMPPEMALKDVVHQGAWSDVYLLGAILYQILTGHRLHTAETTELLLEQIIQGKIPKFSQNIMKEMKDLLHASLAFSNEQRLPNAQAFYLLLAEAIRTSKSRKVEQKAWQNYHDLLAELQKKLPKKYLLENLFEDAKHFFWTALELWPNNIEARQGLDQTLSMWARYLLNMEEVASAERIAGEIDQPDENLLAEIAYVKGQKEQEAEQHVKLKTWKEEEDLSSSRTLRVLLAYLGFFLFGVGSFLFDMIARITGVGIDAKSSLLSAMVLSTLAILGFLVLSPKDQVGTANNSFIRLIRLLLIILIAVVIQRFIVWYTMPHNQFSLVYEMVLLVVGCSAMSTVSAQKDFIWGAFAFTVSIIVSLVVPSLATLLYALSMLSLWGGVLWSWKKEGFEH